MPKGKAKNKKFYAVAMGRQPGIFGTWEECKTQVYQYRNARYKSFPTYADAQTFLEEHTNGNNPVVATGVAAENSKQDPTKRVKGENEEGNTVIDKKRPHPDSHHHPPTAGATGVVDESQKSSETSNSNKKRRRMTTATTTATAGLISLNQTRPPHCCFRINISFDGGARGNPGIAGAGAAATILQTSSVVGHNSNNNNQQQQQQQISRKVLHLRQFVGSNATNNQAEYQGLVLGLKAVRHEIITIASQEDDNLLQSSTDNNNNTNAPPAPPQQQHELIIQGDSDLIVRQIKGEYKCRNTKLQGHYRDVLALLDTIKGLLPDVRVTIQHVYRSDNTVADDLANQAMDAQRSWLTTSDDNHEAQLLLSILD